MAMAGFAALLIAARPLAADIRLGGLDEQFLRAAAHFAGYGVLAVLLALATGRTIAACAVALILAALEEAYQGYVPGRTASLGDWMCDALGIATCLVLRLLVARLRVMRAWRSTVVTANAVAVLPSPGSSCRARRRSGLS